MYGSWVGGGVANLGYEDDFRRGPTLQSGAAEQRTATLSSTGSKCKCVAGRDPAAGVRQITQSCVCTHVLNETVKISLLFSC